MLFLPHKLLVLALLAIFEWQLMKNMLAIFISFILWSLVVVYLSKKINYTLNFAYLPLYFFFYSPIWTIVSAASLIKMLLYRLSGREIRLKNWKI